MDATKELNALMSQNRMEEALKLATKIADETTDDAAAWFAAGKVFWRAGMQSRAMVCYEHAAQLDPAGPAATALEHARSIRDFYNPDMLNP